MGIAIFVILILICTYMVIRKKENFIYVFMFLYPILPEYFAININPSLPLLTAARCLFVLLIIFTIINKFKFKELKNEKNKLKYIKEHLINLKSLIDTKFIIALIVLFVGETINFISHHNIRNNYKEYFKIIVENILAVIVLLMNIDTREKKEKCIKILVIAAGVVFTFSIIESIFGINLAEFLDTGASNTVLKVTYYRLEKRRATLSFGHPIALSLYVVMILPFIVYCVEKYEKWLYKAIYVLGIWTLLFTMTRGQIIIGGALIITMFFFLQKKHRKQYVILTVLAVISACIINYKIIYVFLNIIYSVLNMFGCNFKVENWGENQNGFDRFDQMSMISEVTKDTPATQSIVGGGESYIERNVVQVTRANGTQYQAVSIDNQYLELFINKGIIGLICNAFVYLFLIFMFVKTKVKTDLSKTLLLSTIVTLISYFTTCQLTTNRFFGILVCLIILENYQNMNNKN